MDYDDVPQRRSGRRHVLISPGCLAVGFLRSACALEVVGRLHPSRCIHILAPVHHQRVGDCLPRLPSSFQLSGAWIRLIEI